MKREPALRRCAVLLVALLSGCGGGGGAADSPVPTWRLPYSDEGLASELVGEVSWDLASGCVFLSLEGVRYPVVFASGAELDAAGSELLLPNGSIVTQGDLLGGGGGFVSKVDLPEMWSGGDVPPDACFVNGSAADQVAVFNNSADTPLLIEP